MSAQSTPASPLPDRWCAGVFLLAALGLRLLYAWHFRIDSDEPQHLHVVWAWTQGLLPYRDVFDNHTPLFQALCAPLFHALGVRPDILLPMRVAMIPLFAATIWCVWKIARTFFTARTALWTAVLAAFCPPFFLTSVEFRPDELWTLLWLLTLTVLATGPLTKARLFSAGLLVGTAFSVSMKSSLLLAALGFAFLGLLVFRRAAGERPAWSWIGQGACSAAVGMLVIPALTVLFFITHGAGPQMLQCVIKHNILPGGHSAGRLVKFTFHWLLWLLPVTAGGVLITRLPHATAVRDRIVFIFFAAALYYSTLICFWPILTDEDYLPFYPAMAITVAPALFWLGDFVGRKLRLPAVVMPALFAATSLACIVRAQSPLRDETADKIGIVADTLKLTRANDLVMDSKGETIYRQRTMPHLILEGLTTKRIKLGLLPDDIAAQLIATRTPLVTMRRMPQQARAFIKANYVPIAYRLRVLGQVLREDGPPVAGPLRFTIAVPASYTLVTRAGVAAGLLDGTPFTGPRDLAAGPHEFLPATDAGRLILVWARAVGRGYSPFTELKSDQTTEQD